MAAAAFTNEKLEVLNTNFLKEVQFLAVVFEHFHDGEYEISNPPFDLSKREYGYFCSISSKRLRNLLLKIPAIRTLVVTVEDVSNLVFALTDHPSTSLSP
jgi:hypothetical protein